MPSLSGLGNNLHVQATERLRFSVCIIYGDYTLLVLIVLVDRLFTLIIAYVLGTAMHCEYYFYAISEYN